MYTIVVDTKLSYEELVKAIFAADPDAQILEDNVEQSGPMSDEEWDYLLKRIDEMIKTTDESAEIIA